MKIHCIAHNLDITLASPPGHPEVLLFECPVCLREKLTEARKALKTTTEQRDVLLKAIHIKQLVQMLDEPESTPS